MDGASPRAATATELTRAEVVLTRVLTVLGVVFALLVGYYVGLGVFANAEYPFVANSAAKDGLFAALCIVAANDIRRFTWAVYVVIGGHVLLIAGLLVMGATGNIASVAGSLDIPGADTPSPEAQWAIWLGLATAITALVIVLFGRAQRERYQLRYLSQAQHRTLMALAEVLVMGDDEVLTPEQVAGNVDEYLHSFAAKGKRKLKLALSALTVYPMLRLRPPLPILSPERRRRFVERCFIKDVAERRLPGPLRRIVQSMLYAAQQLAFIGYYGDPRTAHATGYVPFSRRPGYREKLARGETDRPRLSSRTPREIDGDLVTADVAVVGSGAAGAIIAYRLAEAGREVVVVERGRHVDPSQFTEDERVQYSNLYADGALQLSSDARFGVLQGMCVGGSTVVNNAVCIELPAPVLERWNDPAGLDAGLSEPRLESAFRSVSDFLPVTPQAGSAPFQAGARPFEEGVRKLGLDRPPNRFAAVNANIAGCLGCGYCNYGCAFGKKLSVLDTALPWAQQRFGTDALRVLAECSAERIERDGRRATGVTCRLSDGREMRLRANTVVVSAGALASSLLLQRSSIGGKLAGKGVCFNMGAPMTAEFEERLDSFAGLQITHTLEPAGEEGLILETWFNPVGAQALVMPGWLSDHFRNMRRYNHMTSVGSVVGTKGNGRVGRSLLSRDMKLDFEPDPEDLARLLRGLKLSGRIMLEAGAIRVMPSTFRYMPIESVEQLDELDRHVRDNTDISLNSAHPQGGNALSRDPSKGVVGPDFRVHGFDNLHLCDASVFPSAVTVNPQLTVMALAELAAAEAVGA